MNYELVYGYLCHDLQFDHWLDEVAANTFCEQLNLVAAKAKVKELHAVRVARDGKSWCVLVVQGEST